MSRIFISYRRDDTAADMTDRLYERLVRRWGRRVFMDIDSLVGGDLFAKAIEENLQNCAVVLVIIGRHWLSLTNERGVRRIDDPGDYPRMEVAAALRRGIRVIPVLVGGAPLPKPEELPQDIAGLLDRQIVRVSRERFDADVQQLVAAVAREMPRRSWRDLPWQAAAAALTVLAIVTAGYFSFFKTDSSTHRAETPAVSSSPIAKEKPTVQAKEQSEAGPSAAVSAPKESSVALAPSGRDKPISPPNLSGKWGTPVIQSPYDTDQYTLLFEFVQQGDTLLGTVTHTSVGSGRGYSSAIVEGKVKDGVVSFHTKGEVWVGRTTKPYQQMYVGMISKDRRQIAFQRYNDVSGGGKIERFLAKLE
jgi:hypothetical protein